jgi:SHS2 domain-containing protein
VVQFVARLREERRFANIEDLIAQIEQDSSAARSILGSEGVRKDVPKSSSAPCRYRYRELDHTADRALWVWGQGLSDLFAGAAWGMYSLMGDLHGLVATHWKEIKLDAEDLEVLLVEWLNELLYFTEIEELLFLDFRIESVTADARFPSGPQVDAHAAAQLVAQVGAVKALPTRAHIKAATFHNISLVKDKDGWSTEITFDV